MQSTTKGNLFPAERRQAEERNPVRSISSSDRAVLHLTNMFRMQTLGCARIWQSTCCMRGIFKDCLINIKMQLISRYLFVKEDLIVGLPLLALWRVIPGGTESSEP